MLNSRGHRGHAIYRPLHIAVLIKQVPRFEAMELGLDGRLVRTGLPLEMNPYCRRAVSKGVELARDSGGRCTAVTLGPPTAEDCLREAVAWGADAGLLVSDVAFAGSDTLATARALAAALRLLSPIDLVLCGRNSVDADTAQVPPELAELLNRPFAGGLRELAVEDEELLVLCEHDDGWVSARLPLPAVLSCAERLCQPAKVDAASCAAVSPDSVRHVSADELGPGPWGASGSPTVVGRVQRLAVKRLGLRLEGDVDTQVRGLMEVLHERGALVRQPSEPVDAVPLAASRPGGPVVAALLEPDRPRIARELLGGAAGLAHQLGGTVIALSTADIASPQLADWGADIVADLDPRLGEAALAQAVAAWCASSSPWGVLAPATMWGREVASRVAARLSAGLVGDVVDLDIDQGRLVCWKPAFGGGLVAAVTCTTTLQMATLRPGVLPLLHPREATASRMSVPVAAGGPLVRVLERARDDNVDVLATADAVVAVGMGILPDEYPVLDPLLDALGAELAATRRVTDEGWLPRARQVGLTGRSIAPRLYVALGIGGKFNHVVGARGAGLIVAVNRDANAPIFDAADVGLIADWHEVVPRLASALEAVNAGM